MTNPLPNIAEHPSFVKIRESYEILRDSYEGEEVIKDKRTKYLPATKSQILDGMQKATDIGYKDYENYLSRAVFPDFIRDAIEIAIGLMHKKSPIFKLPKEMEYLLEKATPDGDNLETLLLKINCEQILMGRLGLLIDIDLAANKTNLPYIVLHKAEYIPNWNADPNLDIVVINESGPILQKESLTYKDEKKYRVLGLDESGNYIQRIHEGDYRTAMEISPTYLGKKLNEIPFEFINVKDNTAVIDRSPLLGLARLCLSIYKSEADYRYSLHMQGQDTLVVIGGSVEEETGNEDGIRIGAGAMLDVESGGDAKFIGVSADGIGEQRQALINDRDQARSKTVQLQGSLATRDSESSGSRRMRLQSETANLTQIAEIGAIGLESVLKKQAIWMGLNPSDVSVTANKEFADMTIDGQNLVQIVTAKTVGAPISWESIHRFMMEKGLTKMSFEDELAKILSEGATLPGTTSPTPPGSDDRL